MAWPKKYTRTINVNNERYLWHLSGNWLEGTGTVITIGKEKERFFLYVDPYAWEITIQPSTIRQVIEWANGEGWTAEQGPTRSLTYSAEHQTYIWLPDGIRYRFQVPK